MTPADLKAARKRLGLSQAGLAEALRMGKHGGRTVRRWELGEGEIPGPVQVAVGLILQVHRPDEEKQATGGYAVLLRPLTEAEGGGWIAEVPELPGCMSDGATGDEAFQNVLDAMEEWQEEARRLGRPIPGPGSGRRHRPR